MAEFNLVQEPWIPCIKPDGTIEDQGLLPALTRAHEFVGIEHHSPLVTAALHRLLLAILHRVFGPRTLDDWKDLWERGRFPEEPLIHYFDQWRDRFDLFDTQRPFYQCPGLDPKRYAVTAAKLTPERASGNEATLFDHTHDADPPSFSPPEAACLLVAHLAFAPGGLVTYEKKEDKSATMAPLAKGAVAILQGNNLFQTLMFNLQRYAPHAEQPFPAQDDAPAWEQNEPANLQVRRPKGLLDYLTWQSRRVLLVPEDSNGSVVVRKVIIMKGRQFPEGTTLKDYEPMIAFRKNPNPSKSRPEPWLPIAFTENRALWRDSLALFAATSQTTSRPRNLDWASSLAAQGLLDRALIFPLDLFGLALDRAKVHLWRRETLPLPLAYLDDGALIAALSHALDLAEKVESGVLAPATWRLAHLLLAPEAKTLNRQQKSDVSNLCNSLAPQGPYWAALETPFKNLLVELPSDKTTVDGVLTYGTTALDNWKDNIRNAARKAFRSATSSLDLSPRSLRALAEAENLFNHNLWSILSPLQKGEAQ